MSILAFSTEWAEAWASALNVHEDYRQAAARWEGSVAAVVSADDARGVLEHAVFLDLWHGECRAARVATPADLEVARYVIRGAPTAWREVLQGALPPLLALMTGKLALARGSLAALVPFAGAAKALVDVAAAVPVSFPETWG